MIKFNAWDKFEKKMILWKDLIENENLIPEVLLNSVRYVPLLFTGIKDKNNNELFDGDSVKLKLDSNGKEYVCNIVWNKSSYISNNGWGLQTIDGYHNNEIRKIGNIYEGLKMEL